MKTTKDIAEMFSAEIDRIAKGEVRTNIIRGLSECSEQMIKLARLEMDFAFRNWGEQPPSIPWISSKPLLALPEPRPPRQIEKAAAHTPTATTSRGQQIEKEIVAAQKQLATASHTMKGILTDKINLLQNKLERAESERDSEKDSE
jgi:hypothetical protein